MASRRASLPARAVPEWLPAGTCVAELTSVQPAADPATDGLALTLVSFQEELAPPILEPARSALVALDWDALASDFEG